MAIDIQTARDAAEPSMVKATARVSVIKPMQGDFRVFYYLTGDGLSDPKWKQENGFSGYDPSEFIPEMEKFCVGGKRIEGLVFNDIVLMLSDSKGIPSSLPQQLAPDNDYSHSYTFDTTRAMSIYDENLADKAKSLKVVAGVVDAESGKVLNCAVAPVSATGAVGDILSDGTVSVEKLLIP